MTADSRAQFTIKCHMIIQTLHYSELLRHIISNSKEVSENTFHSKLILFRFPRWSLSRLQCDAMNYYLDEMMKLFSLIRYLYFISMLSEL